MNITMLTEIIVRHDQDRIAATSDATVTLSVPIWLRASPEPALTGRGVVNYGTAAAHTQRLGQGATVTQR